MSPRVAIIGGGVIGLCSAYYCAKRGMRVTVFERERRESESGERDGCSFGNAGLIVPSHFIPLAAPGMVRLGLKWMWNPESPFYIRPRFDRELFRWGFHFMRAATQSRVAKAAPLLRDLNLASRICFEELASSCDNAFELNKRGLLMLCQSQHTLDEEAKVAEQANRLGINAEVLDASQTAARDPNVRMEVSGSVYYTQDCSLSPHRLMQSLQTACEAMGVTFRWNAEVTAIRRTSDRIEAISTFEDEIEVDDVILCSGVWSADLANQIGLRLPMQAGKGYSLTLKAPRVRPQHAAILTEARIAVTPMGEQLRFGGTMELNGMNLDIDPRRVRGIIKAIPKYYPDMDVNDFEGVQAWRGLRPCSPDGLPYVGRTSKVKNLVVATGHAMMGVSLGPITGQLVASIIANEPLSIPIGLLSPDRYG